jgi:hypothetical protein
MVLFPSLLKIRKSDLKVAFCVITRRFSVVLSRYPVTLDTN